MRFVDLPDGFKALQIDLNTPLLELRRAILSFTNTQAVSINKDAVVQVFAERGSDWPEPILSCKNKDWIVKNLKTKCCISIANSKFKEDYILQPAKRDVYRMFQYEAMQLPFKASKPLITEQFLKSIEDFTHSRYIATSDDPDDFYIFGYIYRDKVALVSEECRVTDKNLWIIRPGDWFVKHTPIRKSGAVGPPSTIQIVSDSDFAEQYIPGFARQAYHMLGLK